MGMMIGSSSNATRIELRDKNGALTGTLTISTPKKSTKTKKVNYNYKKISKQIMQSKTSTNSRRVVTSARREVVSLVRMQQSGKYDENELRRAIVHARKMERIARKKMKHLQEEEKAKQTGKGLVEKEQETNGREQLEQSVENRMTEEELQELLEEYEKLLQEIEDTSGMDDLMKEYAGATEVEMTPEELENFRKMHRAKEQKEIVEADMEYLKAVFNKLASDKANGPDISSQLGVSLELQGAGMPVDSAASAVSAAELVEGSTVDVSA